MEKQSNTTHSRFSYLDSKFLNIYIDKVSASELKERCLSTNSQKKDAQLSIQSKAKGLEFKVNNIKLLTNSLDEYLFGKIENVHSYENIISKTFEYKKKDDLRIYLKSLTQISELIGFNSAQILVHQKGTTDIYSLTYRNDDYIETFEDPLFFNNLFSKVKKSKNKSFDQKELLNKNIKLDGHFLAKEIQLKEFNLLVLLSRDDLFPIALQERESFNLFIAKSIPRISNIIAFENNRKNNRERDNILNNFPINSFELSDDSVSIKSAQEESHKHDTSSLHHERILLMGDLLNTLRHELSNPLFGIDLSHNLLKEQTSDFDVKDTLEHISSSVKRSQAIIQEFSNLYQEDESLSTISIKNLISETIILTKSESRSHRVIFEMNDDIEILSNGTLLSQVIFNLLINSSQSLNNSNITDTRIVVQVIDKQDSINIDIIDNGGGIPEHLKESIFNPFFTTKDTGTGLGLAICRNLLKKISGDITLVDSDYGAHFRITLNKGIHESISH